MTAQHQESDCDFLNRQLAHWGLFYHFEQTDDAYKLIIRDKVVTFDISEQGTEKQPLLGKGVTNPFRGFGTVGISALAGVLYLINLKPGQKSNRLWR